MPGAQFHHPFTVDLWGRSVADGQVGSSVKTAHVRVQGLDAFLCSNSRAAHAPHAAAASPLWESALKDLVLNMGRVTGSAGHKHHWRRGKRKAINEAVNEAVHEEINQAIREQKIRQCLEHQSE